MTTWYSHWPLSHPWMPTLKRKHSDSPNLDSGSSSGSDLDTGFQSSAPPNVTLHASGTPHAKRRRYDLARNLSHLSLFEQVQPISHTDAVPSSQDVNISPWSSTSPGATMDADGDVPVLDIVRPIVEEPADVASTIPEVRMRHSSSYEPEKDRIVITDLDSSEDEADTPPHTPAGDNVPYSVSPAFLSRIKGSKVLTPLMKPIASPPDSDPSRALVLFTPSPWSAKDPGELEEMYRARDTDKQNFKPIVTEVPDADAMEVE